jgi:single-stranded-DNA-specific exonuclease
MPGEIIPEAAAILDPKQPDCNYPFKELSGCGVGFKLLQALTMKSILPD